MAHTAHKDEAMMEEIVCPVDELAAHAVTLAEMIRASSHVVFFTGAGISTSAGIPDFRGPTGVWTMAAKGQAAAARPRPTASELNATSSGRATVSMSSAHPTFTHMAMVALHRAGRLHHVISQNVDGLHRKSGMPASAISELHGNSNVEECNACGKRYFRDFRVVATRGNHFTGRTCGAEGCTGALRDSIINFGEDLPMRELRDGFENAGRATLHVCLGSSLTVSPACDMPRETKKNGGRVVIVNLQRTPLDNIADLRVHAPTDDLMRLVMAHLGIEVPAFTLRRQITVWRERGSGDSPSSGAVVNVSGVDVSDNNCPQSLVASLTLSPEATAVGYVSVVKDSDPVTIIRRPLSADEEDGQPHQSEQVPTATIEFFGHYHEPPLALPLLMGKEKAVTYDIELDFDPSSTTTPSTTQWRMRRLDQPALPNFAKGSGPSRRDSHAGRAAPAPAANQVDMTGWFAVSPIPDCEHCRQVQLRPEVTFDVSAPCGECGNVGENMICLTCFAVHCGRHVQQHMLAHHESSGHPVVGGFADLSFWCYPCEAYISDRNPRIQPIYQLLAASKFPASSP